MPIIAPARPQIIEYSGRSVGGLGGLLVGRSGWSVGLVGRKPTHTESTQAPVMKEVLTCK